MRRSQKSKRVNWASDVNLCQVKLFLTEDSPSQIGIGTQDHLQAKALWSAQTGGLGSYDNLPPGFEGVQPRNPWTSKLSQIPLVKWKFPPRFKVNIDWQVVAGEESKEIETQNQREMRVLEAIYLRPSAIPPNPTLSGIETRPHNDLHTPVIPITPIEDEDTTPDTPLGGPTNPMISHHPQHSSHATSSSQGGNNIAIVNPRQPNVVEADVVAAAQIAQIALTSGMSNNGQGNNNNKIDSGLLIKILSDPKMIEQLMTNLNASSTSTPAVGSRSPIPSDMHNNNNNNTLPSTSSIHYVPNSRSPQNNPVSRRDPPLSIGGAARAIPPSGPFYPAPSPPVGTKDMNYYKSLIQQHGGERRESSTSSVTPPQFGHQVSRENPKTRESKPKITRPCVYFNSPKGCRNGADCLYQHDSSVVRQRVGGGIPEIQSTKRAKMDREITGS